MILATFSFLLLLLALVLVVLLLLLLKEEYQKHLPVWQSYQIHTVHRKSPNTGALRPSISNGKWDNVLSQEKSKHRGIAAVNFEWQMGQCLIPWRAPPCVCRGRRTPPCVCRGRRIYIYISVCVCQMVVCSSERSTFAGLR